MPAAFQHVQRAHQVVFHQLPAARLPVGPGQHTGIRGAIHDPIHLRQRVHIALAAQIAVIQPEAEPAQFGAIAFAAGPRQVVQARQRPIQAGLFDRLNEAAPHEAAGARDENFHGFRFTHEVWISSKVVRKFFVMSQPG